MRIEEWERRFDCAFFVFFPFSSSLGAERGMWVLSAESMDEVDTLAGDCVWDSFFLDRNRNGTEKDEEVSAWSEQFLACWSLVFWFTWLYWFDEENGNPGMME